MVKIRLEQERYDQSSRPKSFEELEEIVLLIAYPPLMRHQDETEIGIVPIKDKFKKYWGKLKESLRNKDPFIIKGALYDYGYMFMKDRRRIKDLDIMEIEYVMEAIIQQDILRFKEDDAGYPLTPTYYFGRDFKVIV